MGRRAGEVRALVPYFGGKRTMAGRIAAALGPHDTFFELCCGSMAVLLAKPRSRMEVAVDLHRDLTNLARVIARPALGASLYRRLRRTLFAEGLLADALAALEGPPPGDEPDVGRAYAYFLVCWMGLNGHAGTDKAGASLSRRFTANGGDPAVRLRSAGASIPAFTRRLSGVQVWTMDLFDVAPRIEDRPGVSVYVDPPYLAKGARYLHDFAAKGEDKPGGPPVDPLVLEFGDHGRLALALRRFGRTRVVVSYYADASLGALYPGWHVLEVDAAKGLAQPARLGEAGRTAAPEVLLSNLPFLPEATEGDDRWRITAS